METRLASWEQLLPEEHALVASAVPKRVREFAAGRLLARRLIAQLDGTTGPLLVAAGRQPSWPSDVVGSITHTDRWAAVAVAFARDVAAIGIDLEPAEPLPDGLLPMVTTGGEEARLSNAPEPMSRVLFSAKEAFYKAQFGISRTLLGFEDVEVELSEDGHFVARLARHAGPFAVGRTFHGRWRIDGGLIATAVTLTGVG